MNPVRRLAAWWRDATPHAPPGPFEPGQADDQLRFLEVVAASSAADFGGIPLEWSRVVSDHLNGRRDR